MLKAIFTAVVVAGASVRLGAAEIKPIDPTLLKRFEPGIFTNRSGHVLKYRLARPSSYEVRTNYPLVLILHGAAGLGDDNARQFNGGNEVVPLALVDDKLQEKFPCFVLVPQCPRGSSWSGSGAQPSTVTLATLATIDSLKRQFKIDSRRLYVIGVSMGGHGVWDVISRFPGTFAAAVPICGAGEVTRVSNIVTLPIWCFHGADDPLVNVSYARKMMEALRAAGGHPKYTEYPGVGHDSYRNACREPGLFPWLFAQQRNN
jgi:predicted peptidase